MTNAWSLLYDELNMTQTLGEEDCGYMLNLGTHLPGAASPDTITFTSTGYDGLDLGDPGPFAAQPVPYDSFMGIRRSSTWEMSSQIQHVTVVFFAKCLSHVQFVVK